MPETSGARLLRFVRETREEELPKPALEHARLAVLDWWGVTVGGAEEPVARVLRETIGVPSGPASVLGTPLRTAPLTAAALNGTAAHALDYDDTTTALPGHLTAPILPGLLAVAEARGLGGRPLVGALLLGVEAASRVARGLAPGHYRSGWHATTTMGRLGAAAAVGRLLGLDAARLDAAIGLAIVQIGGVQEAFGSMAKPFQVGRAAADGLLAALAAEAGVSRPGRSPRPRRLGAAAIAHVGPGAARRGAGDALGHRPHVLQALPLLLRHPRRDPWLAGHHAVARRRDGGNRGHRGGSHRAPGRRPAEADHRPRRQVQPDVLRGGRALARPRGEDDFTDAAVADPAARALAERVRLVPDPALDETRARVRVRLASGETRERTADVAGHDDPADLRRDLTAKFRALVAPRLGEPAAARLLAALEHIDQLDDMRELQPGP